MLPCICSVIDQRWRQIVVKTKKWHMSRRRVCHWCFYHLWLNMYLICFQSGHTPEANPPLLAFWMSRDNTTTLPKSSNDTTVKEENVTKQKSTKEFQTPSRRPRFVNNNTLLNHKGYEFEQHEAVLKMSSSLIGTCNRDFLQWQNHYYIEINTPKNVISCVDIVLVIL